MSPNFVLADLLEFCDRKLAIRVIAVASAAALIALSARWIYLNFSEIKQKVSGITHRPLPGEHKAAPAQREDSDRASDSGYAGSNADSEGDEDWEMVSTPRCDSRMDSDEPDSDELDENYDLHRAIRLCQETATPKRPPPSPYGEDFKMVANFLSATENKAKSARRVAQDAVD